MALKRLTPRGPAEAALSPPPPPQEMSFFAYLLAAADNPAKHNYKGSTQDFSVRLLQHNGTCLTALTARFRTGRGSSWRL